MYKDFNNLRIIIVPKSNNKLVFKITNKNKDYFYYKLNKNIIKKYQNRRSMRFISISIYAKYFQCIKIMLKKN